MSRFHRARGYHSTNRPKMRQLVWDTYPHVCFLCGGPIPTMKEMEVDHIQPLSQGGAPLDLANVRPSHPTCNRRRGTKTLEEYKPLPRASRPW